MSLSWQNINITVPNKNKNIKDPYIDIIKQSSGSIKPGEILAIMGPSGGGKTTLLNALAGRIPPGSYTQGEILYNNKPRDKDDWIKRIGFVDQDDVVYEELTIEETLSYAAHFRLHSENQSQISDDKNDNETTNSSWKEKITNIYKRFRRINKKKELDVNRYSDNEINNFLYDENKNVINENTKKENDLFIESEHVNKIYKHSDRTKHIYKTIETQQSSQIRNNVNNLLIDLNLDSVSKNEIKKISGGERKRTMIAIELITNPDIIFLDEPTSGLDTLTALKICKILKRLAMEKNKIIILTIHQPSSEIFYLFDQVLLLSQGNVIFYDSTKLVESFFQEKGMLKREQITVPEFIVEICSEDYKKENPSLFYSENSVFRDKIVLKDKNIRKKKNDFYISFVLCLKDVLLLIKRRLSIEMHRKVAFLKTQSAKLLICLVLVYFNYQTHKMLNTNPGALIQGMNRNFLLNNDNSDIKNTVGVMIKGMILTSSLFMMVFSQVSSVISSFFDEEKLIKREIAVGSYSASSYFVSLFFFLIIIESIGPIIAFFFSWKYIPITDIYMFISFFFSALVTVPFGLMIGSISTNKQIVIILSSIFGTLSALPPSTISMFNGKYGINPDGSQNGFSKVSYLTLLFSTVHYCGLLCYKCYKSGYDSIESDYLKNYVSHMMSSQIDYVDFWVFNSLFLLILMLLVTWICFLAGICLFGWNMMPEIRMVLEKDYKNKSK